MQKLLVASLLLVACGKKEDKAAPAAAEKPAPTAEAPVAAPEPTAAPKAADTSNGSCRVVVSGAVTSDDTTGNTGPMALAVYQWLAPEARKTVGYPEEGMILNCMGEKSQINLLTKASKPFPQKPGTYTIGQDGEISVLGSLKAPGGDVSIMQSKGELQITAFDNAHIAGTAKIKAATAPDKGEVTIDVTFDMKCFKQAACP